MSDAPNALAFERVGEPPGIEVIDRIEQQRYSVHTSEEVKPTEISTDGFQFPVSDAVEFTTSYLTFPTPSLVFIHDEEGEIIDRVDHEGTASFAAGTYTLEFAAQIKTYIDVESAIEIESSTTELQIQFEEPVAIRYGIRSHHEHPAGTVTTTTAPSDVMAAIQTFGSALKVTDPERSYPTLRGHPPEIEIGEELNIPDGFEPPENGIRLQLPLDLEHLVVAAPLVFYLGATVEPGPTPRLITDDGFEYPLDRPEDFQNTVGKVLRQIFFFDCITRTEGLYQLPLAERNQIEPLVKIDFAKLYEQPMAEQVATYLNVPFTVIEEHLPEWPLTTHVEPNAKTIEQLPYVVDDLAIIRSSQSSMMAPREQPEAPNVSNSDVLTRSAGSQEAATDDNFVQPVQTDTVEQAWIGADIPIGASKLTPAAFQNRVDRQISEGDIEISIVVNDDRMNMEGDIVDQTYGDRANLPFDVSISRNTTVEELRELLGQQSGYLHYIGHTEHDGFQCSDGKLDATTIDEVGIESFLLNACNSYKQGLALIERGAIGGIVTLADIINKEGVNMGVSVARLLNAGFPLQASLTIAGEESIQGGQYIVVGDGGMSVTQPDGAVPTLIEVEYVNDQFDLGITTFTNDTVDIGSVCKPRFPKAENYYLASNHVDGFSLSRDVLSELLEIGEVPIRSNGSLYWSSSIGIRDLEN